MRGRRARRPCLKPEKRKPGGKAGKTTTKKNWKTENSNAFSKEITLTIAKPDFRGKEATLHDRK